MTQFIVFVMSLLFLCSAGLADSYDRAAQHAARLQDMEISSRGLLSRRSGPTASSDSYTDLEISQSTAPARFTQDNSDLVSLSGGGWLTVWNDNRQGSRAIFSQRLNSLMNRVGSNVLLAGSATGSNFVEPKLAVDSLGRIYLFYRDQTLGLLLGARFRQDLTVDLSEFLVNDTSLASFAGPFDFAVFPDGRMVIVWENYSALGSTISMRIYNPSGVSVVGPVAVNSEGGGSQHWVPSVAVAPGSGFLVVWEDYRNSQPDVYARLFSGNGSPVGSDFSIVPPPADAAAQYAPRTASTGNGKYVVFWEDHRAGREIYFQQYSSNIGLIGNNKLLSGGDTLVSNRGVNLAVASDGSLLAAWGAFGPANSLMAVRIDPSLNPVGTPREHNIATVGRRWSPSADFSAPNLFGLAWTEFQDQDADIHFMAFDTMGVAIAGEEAVLNDDTKGAPSHSPDIKASTDWYNLVVWCDKRNDAGDIYIDAVSNAGIPRDRDFRVNQDSGPDLQGEPSLAVGNDKALVVWVDSRPLAGKAGQRIFGRFASTIGIFTENEFLISDSGQSAVKGAPEAVLTSSGRGLVYWQDKRVDSSSQIWGRWLAADGSPDGAEFQISNQVSDEQNVDLHGGRDGLGNSYVVWLDEMAAGSRVKGKWFKTDKSVGGSFSWESSVDDVAIDDISVDINAAGEIILLWSGAEGSVRNVYLTRLGTTGALLTAPKVVNSNVAADASDPSVSVSTNGYVSAAWVDRRDGTRRIYYQLFDNLLAAMDENQPVSTSIPAYMESPATTAHRGRAWFVWADPRANGLNVYASFLVYLPTDSDDPRGTELPNLYHLGQNYPNPFNPATTIEFSLPAASDLTIAVFNTLGQLVTTLATGPYPAGDHQVIWDGRNRAGQSVSSGIYFYQLQTDAFTERRKMILLK